jgi:hypothetical protein
VASRYRLLAEVGRGASATVWHARDDRLDVDVAVKLLHIADPALRKQFRSRLHAEGSILARIGHPFVLRVFDSGTDGSDDYIVTELADGGTLADALDRQGSLPPRHAARYVLQVLAALQAAHEAGVVHRDVKPANLLLVRGEVRLADFGIAIGREDGRNTRTGVAMGSWAFMAPEQRIDARSVGATADIYATGATLYNLVTGATPTDLFLADRGSPRWADVPDVLIPVLRRATQGRPEARWRTAADMAVALAPLLDVLPTVALTPRRPPDGTPVYATTAQAPAAPTLTVESLGPSAPAPIAVRPRILGLIPAVALVMATTLVGIWASRVWLPVREVAPGPAASAPDAVPIPAPLGLWRGRIGERAASVALRGTEDGLTAEVTVHLGANASVHVARASWDPDSATLALSDIGDFPEAADWSATLTASGVTLEGTGVTRASHETFTVNLLLEP